MTEDEDNERLSWIPFALAGGLVAIILAVIFTVDGSYDDPGPKSPSSPTSSATP